MNEVYELQELFYWLGTCLENAPDDLTDKENEVYETMASLLDEMQDVGF